MQCVQHFMADSTVFRSSHIQTVHVPHTHTHTHRQHNRETRTTLGAGPALSLPAHDTKRATYKAFRLPTSLHSPAMAEQSFFSAQGAVSCTSFSCPTARASHTLLSGASPAGRSKGTPQECMESPIMISTRN